MEKKKALLLKEYNDNKNLYLDFTQKMEDLIKVLLSEHGIKCASINSRLKEEDSFSKKIERKDYKYSEIKEITDTCGLRVITYYADSVNKVADIITNEFKLDKDNTIDKTEAIEPDKFGYLSMHYVVEFSKKRIKLSEYNRFKGLKIEIQIRSLAQHLWAEVEHDLGYKSEVGVPKKTKRSFSRMASLLEIVDREFINIRDELSKYEKKVKKQFRSVSKSNHKSKNVLDSMPLDLVTIKYYIENSKNLIKINDSIANIINVKWNTKGECKSILDMLSYFKYQTIGEIDKDIIKNRKQIIDIAKEILDDETKGPLRNDIGLFYLCYFKLAQKGSVKDFEEYFKKSEIYFGDEDEDEDEDERATFIKDIMKAYKNSLKNK